MMTQGQFLNAARSFDADETRIMRDAYVCASEAFGVTHHTDAALETKLASIVLFIYTADKITHPKRPVDVRELAEESLETLIRYSNSKPKLYITTIGMEPPSTIS